MMIGQCPLMTFSEDQLHLSILDIHLPEGMHDLAFIDLFLSDLLSLPSFRYYSSYVKAVGIGNKFEFLRP